MSPQQWAAVKELFETVLKLEPEQRSDFLQNRVSDKAVSDELESLLAEEEGAASFLEVPAIEIAFGSSEESNSLVAWGQLEPGTRIGPYEVLAYLGCGGMGHVYHAKDTRLGRDVALKFLCDNATASAHVLERFKREARAASVLNHPNICTLHDIGDFEGRPFLVMEFLDGESLKVRLTRGPLSVPEVVNFGIQIAQALEALEAEGIIHRDIKPANIFLTQRGQAKLLDLGVAKMLHAGLPAEAIPRAAKMTAPADVTITSYGAAIGTVGFMAPEQVRGEQIDARADLFSLGVTLYQMATGRLPFGGSSVELTLDSILHSAPVKPRILNPRLPRELEAIILKTLRKEKALRHRDAAELRADLERLRTQAHLSRRTWWPVVGAAAPVLTLGVILAGLRLGWFASPAATPELNARQVTANPPEDTVRRAAISPDGTYVAYTDLAGIHVRRISTGETRLISPPNGGSCFR